jgi:pimeloyl-ACP methyl ester carboxylesterase
MKLCLGIAGILLSYVGVCQSVAPKETTTSEMSVTLTTANGNIAGWLTMPTGSGKKTVALIIAGSGPTDKDGNNPVMKNNSLKMLSDTLVQHGIATLRYDKRGIGASGEAAKAKVDIRFDDFVADASGWIQWLKKDGRFGSVVVIGHSEGSLIGMLVASEANAYVSLAGAGRRADELLKEQFMAQPPMIRDLALPLIDSLAQGKTVDSVNRMLYSVFRPSIQPYIISWFHYDPQVEIAKLKVPVLIVQGEQDIQVKVEDAQRLSKANPKGRLVLIPGMNHVFKHVEGDRSANIKTYNDPLLPNEPELGQQIVAFIRKAKST